MQFISLHLLASALFLGEIMKAEDFSLPEAPQMCTFFKLCGLSIEL